MSVNTKMTAIADEVRDLTGVTSTLTLDAMASNLSDANDEVSSQTNLIAEIVSALEGKASGGSGDSIKTCTVTVVNHSDSTYTIDCIQVTNGISDFNDYMIPMAWGDEGTEEVFEDVLCNSSFKMEYDPEAVTVESEDGTSYKSYLRIIIGTSNTTITIN